MSPDAFHSLIDRSSTDESARWQVDDIDSPVDSEVTWIRPTQYPVLPENHVHIWRADLDSMSADPNRYQELLSADERIRASAFRFAQDRNHFISRRGILRAILGTYVGIAAADVRFTYGANRKPQVTAKPGAEELQFNLSHRDATAVCAVTRRHRIGVDLERINPAIECTRIADAFFTENEKAQMRALSPSARQKFFFYVWCRKEALIKASGGSLHSMLGRQLSVGADVLTTMGQSAWSLQSFMPSPRCAGAIAHEGPLQRIDYFEWPPHLHSDFSSPAT